MSFSKTRGITHEHLFRNGNSIGVVLIYGYDIPDFLKLNMSESMSCKSQLFSKGLDSYSKT